MSPGEPGAPGPERVRAAVAVQGWEAQAVPGEESTIVYYRLEVRLVRADGTAAATVARSAAVTCARSVG